MPETSDLFRYPLEPHRRRHGPRGYASYQQYKPWLRDDGNIEGLTSAGRELIRVCGLDRPDLTEFRGRIIRVANYAGQHGNEFARETFRSWLVYPATLPQLSKLRPPDGNAQTA